jgi:uncharacterized membrane protein YhaH (DUF805 family)
METAMEWYLTVLKKYAVFDGRARRKEYWMYALFNSIIILVLVLLGTMSNSYKAGMALFDLYALATLIPGLAVTVRRLHDTGRSGLWFLIVLVPFIGGIVLFVFTVLDSDPGENEYGPNPKKEAPPGARLPELV